MGFIPPRLMMVSELPGGRKCRWIQAEPTEACLPGHSLWHSRSTHSMLQQPLPLSPALLYLSFISEEGMGTKQACWI